MPPVLRFIAFLALIHVSVCAPTLPADQPTITKYENSNYGNGNYHFSYETSDGIKREESGIIVNIGLTNEHSLILGSYSYTDPDGKLVSVQYTGDENGFHIDMPISDVAQVAFGGVPGNVVASLLGK